MKSGHHCVYDLKYHLILVTKYRKKYFTPQILNRLQEICKDLCSKWSVELIEFGGESDHIHLLISTTPTMQLSKFVGNLKTVSSRTIRKEYQEHFRKFYWKPVLWTRAYCIISSGGAPIDVIRNYIRSQWGIHLHPNHRLWVENSSGELLIKY